MIENENDKNEGETTSEGQETPDPNADLKAELAESKAAIYQMQQMLQQFIKPKEEIPKPLTAEEAKTEWEKNPAKAIATIVKSEVSQELKTYSTQNEKHKWDAKTEADFPILKTDKSFQLAVKQNMDEMIRDGDMKIDSPKLVYRAAQLAALTHKGKPAKPNTSLTDGAEGTDSGSTTVRRPVTTSKEDALCSIFGIDGKSKERFLEKSKARLAKHSRGAKL